MESNIQKEIDEYGHEHILVKKIGEGGQGEVWTTRTDGYIIKRAIHNGEIVNKSNQSELFSFYKNQYKQLRLLPLPFDIHIAFPAALLENSAGYVMRLMDDMIPLSKLRAANLEEYNKSGGLKRRLELLCRVSSVFLELHSAGLVYGDISPNNVFVTADKEFTKPNTWLIDADNMKLASLDPNRGPGVYTPGFVAPEVYNGRAKCSIESDVYALMLMSYDLLAMNHPFKGSRLETTDESEDEWDKSSPEDVAKAPDTDPDTKAYSGELPWIGDRVDTSNKTNNGLPPEHILTDELFMLFNKTFTDGKLSPSERPSIFFIPRAFGRASDLVVTCDSCGWSWYGTQKNKNCPYCKTKTAPLLTIEHEDKLIYVKEVTFKSEKSNPIQILERTFKPFDIKTHGKIHFEIVIEKNNPVYIDLKKGAYTDDSWSISRVINEKEIKENIYENISLEFYQKTNITFYLHNNKKTWKVVLEDLNEVE